MDTITAWWNGWLVGVFSGFFDMIAKVLISVGTLSAALIHWAPVVNAMTTVQVFATAVLGLKVGLDVYSRYILQLSGEDGDPLDSVLIRAAGAAALIWSIPLAVTLAVDIGNKLTSDVPTNSAAGAVTSKLQAADVMKRLVAIGLTASNPTGQLLLAVVMLFLGIGLIVIFFQVTKRSVELAIMVFIGPVLALNFASPDRSLFAAWTRQLLTLAFTQALQLYLLNLTIIGLVTGLKISGFGTDPIHEFVAMIGLMACTIALPAFVAQMTHQATPTGGLLRAERTCDRHANKRMNSTRNRLAYSGIARRAGYAQHVSVGFLSLVDVREDQRALAGHRGALHRPRRHLATGTSALSAHLFRAHVMAAT